MTHTMKHANDYVPHCPVTFRTFSECPVTCRKFSECFTLFQGFFVAVILCFINKEVLNLLCATIRSCAQQTRPTWRRREALDNKPRRGNSWATELNEFENDENASIPLQVQVPVGNLVTSC